MTTTPNEPVQDPDIVPSGDPTQSPVNPGEDPGTPEPEPEPTA